MAFVKSDCNSWKTLIIIALMYNTHALADNTSYIALSSKMARKGQFSVLTNNVANSNTNGYESDGVVFQAVDLAQPSKRNLAFVGVSSSYKNGNPGAVEFTGDPLDIAIVGNGYFKIITPNGERYTLNGSVFINNENILVNTEGMPFSNQDGQAIILPENFVKVEVVSDGTVYVDGLASDTVGVFTFPDKTKLIKEGSNLYHSSVASGPSQNYSIVSQHLRASNVSSVKSTVEMMEIQRSIDAATSIMSSVADLERSVIDKLGK